MDHRKQPRRRGESLVEAIFQATIDELAETGYAKLTMEGVADRAGTGKASLYRRWPSRMELVIDAVQTQFPDPESAPDTGSLRGDLLAAMRWRGKMLSGPAGEALRGVLSDALSDRARTAELRGRSRGTGKREIERIARRAIDRGEITVDAITERRLEVADAMIRQYFLFSGWPIPEEYFVGIVDEILIPLFSTSAHPPPATTETRRSRTQADSESATS